MKYIPNKILQVALVAVSLLGLTTGCEKMRDQYTDCPTRVSLEFIYTLNDEDMDLFDSQVNRLDVYIYNSSGVLVEHKDIAKPVISRNISTMENAIMGDMESENEQFVDLPAGEYSVVVWGNNNPSYYSTVNTHNINTMLLEVRSSISGVVDTFSGSLFHGMTTFTVQYDPQTIKQVVPLTKNSNNIEVIIKQNGGGNVSLGDYKVAITGSNGTYKYDNTAITTKMLQYTPTYQLLSSKSVQADYSVLRLSPNDDMRIAISSGTGTEYYNESLTAKLMTYPGISTQRDFDRLDKYTLVYEVVLNIDGTYSSIKLLKINDWDVISSGVGI